jgi:hypothetical protein
MPILEYTNGMKKQGRGDYHRVIAFEEQYHEEVMAFMNALERRIKRDEESGRTYVGKKGGWQRAKASNK